MRTVVGLSLLLAATDAAATPAVPTESRMSGGATPCTDDAECNYAGHCVASACACDAPFSGPACETFQLYSCVARRPPPFFFECLLPVIDGLIPASSQAERENQEPATSQ